MKRFFASCVGILAIAFSWTAVAADAQNQTISLQPPAGLAQEACPAPIWSGVTAVWGGVTDTRADKAVGTQTKKGEEPIDVSANPPLDQVLNASLKELFAVCGIKFVDKGDANTLKISADIKQFHAGLQKKFFTGSAQASSMLTFTIDKGYASRTVDIGMDMESKDVRKGDIKGLTKALNSLLVATLKEIPAKKQLLDLK